MSSFVAVFRHIQESKLWSPVSLFCTLAVLLLLSIPHRPTNGDEAWLGEQAYWQARDGYPHSTMFEGMVQSETHIVVRHYAFIWLGAQAILLAGFSLWTLRALSICAFVLLLVLLRSTLRNFPSSVWYAVSAALLLSSQFFEYTLYYRPEMMMALLVLACYAALQRAAETNRWYWTALGGCAAGLSMLVHLNGCIVIAAGVLCLLIDRQWSAALVFSLFSALMMSPYAYEASVPRSLSSPTP